VQLLLTHFQLADIDCMLRPPTLEKTRLYRYLEDGATGLMIPHVSTAQKTQELVSAVKFPPLGDRGIDAAGLDVLFTLADPISYTTEANDETFLVVQIETPEAVENVEAIAATKGLAGMFIGPGDLSLRINKTDTDLTMEAAIEKVAAAAKRHNVAWGLPAGTPELLAHYRSMGAQLLNYGSEFMAVKNMLDDSAQVFNTLEAGA
jgi:4-hydroxy-2-oxoheptanedioate aldolase